MLNWNVVIRYRLWPEDDESPQFPAAMRIDGENRGHEIQNGAADPNSGGNVVYLSPGIQTFV